MKMYIKQLFPRFATRDKTGGPEHSTIFAMHERPNNPDLWLPIYQSDHREQVLRLGFETLSTATEPPINSKTPLQ